MRRIDGKTVIAAVALAVSSTLLGLSVVCSNAYTNSSHTFNGAFHGAFYGVAASTADQPSLVALSSAVSGTGEVVLVAEQRDTSQAPVIYRL